MTVVVTVKVSNEERTLREKHLVHDHQEYYKKAPGLEDSVLQAIANFNAPVDDVTVIINIPW